MTAPTVIRHLLPATLAICALASCQVEESCVGDDPRCEITPLFDEAAPTNEWGEAGEGPGGAQDTTTGQTQSANLIDADGDGFAPVDGDCNDNNAHAFPGADEHCDGFDTNCDGIIDNELGHTSVSENDYGADGVPDNISYTTYDASGRMIMRETDTDGDGIIDTADAYYYVFDAAGALIEFQTDTGMDGSIDKVKTYLYDLNGRLEGTEEDVGPDGIANRIDTYIYDDQGRRVGWEMDTNGDGQVNTMYSYYYGVSGSLEGLILDRFNSEGEVTSSSIYRYDYNAAGLMEHVHVDLTADGLLDNTTEYHFDASNRVQSVYTDIGRDFEWDTRTEYVYDAVTGDLIKIEIDTDNDGGIDTRITRWDVCYEP